MLNTGDGMASKTLWTKDNQIFSSGYSNIETNCKRYILSRLFKSILCLAEPIRNNPVFSLYFIVQNYLDLFLKK